MIDLKKLCILFESYAEKFLDGTADNDFNINLKKEHSIFVADYCRNIALLENFDYEKTAFIYSAGLLHDVARFEQFSRYGTFHDAVSIDHGDLGADILGSSEFSSFFDPIEMNVLIHAVKYHNKKDFPHTSDYSEIVTRIVRDADKLDIYRVLTEMTDYENRGTLSHHLSDVDEYSDDIVDDILDGKQISYSRRKTRNDMHLTMLNWVQDLSFEYSFRHFKINNYLEKIMGSLPQTERILKVERHIKNFMEKKLT